MNKLIFVFIFLSFQLNSQIIVGTVTKESGKPISSCVIHGLKSSVRTVTDSTGSYLLEAGVGMNVIEYSAPGYSSLIDTIDVNTGEVRHDVTLFELSSELQEVVIQADKRELANEYIKKAIEKRAYHQELISEYMCDSYCFTSLEKDKYDSLKTDSIIGIEKLNLIEWNAISMYKYPNKFRDEYIAFNDFSETKVFEKLPSINPNAADEMFGRTEYISSDNKSYENPNALIEGINDFHFSLYDNLINANRITENPIISPIADNAFLYYKYFLEQSYYDSLNTLIYEINVVPKFDNEALLKGKLFLQQGDWAIISYDLEVNPKALLFLNDIEMKCEFTKIGDRIVPSKREYRYRIKKENKWIYGLVRLSHSNYKFTVENTKWLETKVYHEDAFTKDSLYWKEKRPFSLKEYELQYIAEQDSIIRYHESEEYLHKMDSIRNKFRLIQVLFNDGYAHVNSFKKYEFTICSVLEAAIHFGVGGYRNNLYGSYQKEFKNGKIIYGKPYLDYGYYNKDLKGSVEGYLLYNRMNFSKIGFQVGNVYDVVKGTQNIQNYIYQTNRVNNKKFEINYSREILNGLYVKTLLNYSDKKSIENIINPPWLDTILQYAGMVKQSFDPYKMVSATFDFEYHIRQKYMIRDNKKKVFPSLWPTLFVTYKKSIPGILGSTSDFDFFEFKVEENLKLNTFGKLNYKFTYGNFLQKKNLQVADFKFFRQSDMGFFSDPMNTLQLLDTNLNTASAYIQTNLIHHFNGFFLNKIWGINKLKLEETIGCSYLLLPQTNFSQFEYYVGIERKFNLFGDVVKFGLFWVNEYNSYAGSDSSIKFGMNFYNVFTDKWDF